MINISECKDELDILINNFGFDRALFDMEQYDDWMSDNFNNLDDAGYHFNGGACRAVISNDNWEFVFKIHVSKYDKVNFCANEEFLYRKAKEEGIESAFAECVLVGIFFGQEVYAMEYCDCDEDSISDESYNYHFAKYCEDEGLDPSSDEAMDEFSDVGYEYEEQDCILEMAGHRWGREFANRVEDFFHRFSINDCHSANWGWKNDELVVVDYAGYGKYAEGIEKMRLAEVAA